VYSPDGSAFLREMTCVNSWPSTHSSSAKLRLW